MRALALLVTLVFVLTAFAGCISGDNPPAETPVEGAEAAEKTVEGAEEAVARASEWKNETLGGDVTTINAGIARLNTLDSDTLQEVRVGKGTLKLVLTVTVQGGQIQMLVGEPGCAANSGCEESVKTSGGTATFEVEEPEGGTWNLRFFCEGPGLNSVSYTVDVGRLVTA